MTMNKILVATDLSELGDRAAHAGGDLARQVGGHLHVLHVAAPGKYGVPPPLTALAREVGSGVQVTTAVATGDPAEEIVKYARTNGIDLIVLGTHGRTGWSRALLGSVAERVVRTAGRPVLTVPAGEPRAPVAEEATRAVAATRCLSCAKPSADLICEPCRAHIRGEALEHKRREERPGRV
jgi:nucleotide-binding universal stress UspA family protein